MNIYQRIILVLGAVALSIVVWGKQFIAYSIPYRNWANIKTTAELVGVLGCTLLIFFALKGISDKK